MNLVEILSAGYIRRANQQGFHVDDAACEDRMSAALTALREAGAVLVPAEPTEAMVEAYGALVAEARLERVVCPKAAYRAMLAATTEGGD